MPTSAMPVSRTPGFRWRRAATGAVGMLALGAAIALAAAVLRAATPVAPPAPVALAQQGASVLAPDSLLNRAAVTLSFRAGAGTSPARPEIELEPAGRPFTGRVSARGRPIPAGVRGVAIHMVLSGLHDGVAYHWRVRLRGRDQRSSGWAMFGAGRRGGAISFRVDLTPPPAPALASPTHPDPRSWYAAPSARIAWPAVHDASGVAGYAYALDCDPHGVPPARPMLRQPSLTLPVPASGLWYVHVRAVDAAGNAGAVATYPLHVDLRPATFAGVTFARVAFNPEVEREAVVVALDNPGRVQAQILRQGDGTVVRALDLGHVQRHTTLLWDGRDAAGRPVPEGPYRFLLTSTDPLGQHAVADYSGIAVVRRRLVVSLSRQRMVVYQGARAVASTLVTTGNKALPTPLGTFHIIEKLHPFTFISPWPQGSPYYYPPSPVQYALLFDWNGFYIHDAPWRSAFGPGSNAVSGTPGQNNTGTHGCINVRPDIAAWLYAWAPVGTVVQVVP